MSPLVVENVWKNYRQGPRTVAALAGINLRVEKGTFLAVMGASGSGKSTLLHLMAGLCAADSGRVLIDDTNLAAMSDRQLTLFRRRKIGLVFQAFNLMPNLTAEENVALPLLLDGQRAREARKQAGTMLEQLNLLPRRGHRPDAMSGGEQQRVAIGRALVTNPTVILADEPTGNLDSSNSRGVCQILRDLAQINGKTIIMVTHEPTVAAYSQEVVVLKDGQVVRRFPTEETNGGSDLALRYQESLR